MTFRIYIKHIKFGLSPMRRTVTLGHNFLESVFFNIKIKICYWKYVICVTKKARSQIGHSIITYGVIHKPIQLMTNVISPKLSKKVLLITEKIVTKTKMNSQLF